MKFNKNLSEELKMKVQKIVDMGRPNDLVQDGNGTAIVYETSEDSIMAHAKGIAQLQEEGLEVMNMKHSITSIELTPHLTEAYKALKDVGASVMYVSAKCLIESKSGKLYTSEGISNLYEN